MQKRLYTRHSQDLTQIKENLKFKKTANWLKYAPSLGWNFIINSPSIGWSSSQIISANNTEDAHRFAIKDAERLSRLAFVNDSIALSHTYRSLLLSLNELPTHLSSFELDFELYKIVKSKHGKVEVSTEVYLSEKKKILQSRLALFSLRSSIIALINQIEVITRTPLSVNLTAFDKYVAFNP